MIGVDTNILARFYVDDPTDSEAERQRPIARRILADQSGVFVPLTVALELEWVVRAFYGFGADAFADLLDHLAGLANVTIEARADVISAADLHRAGLDFADALHLTRSGDCERFVTFDDRKLARRATRLNVAPPVEIAS
jgi:predicted nucleic-acid-binding protein